MSDPRLVARMFDAVARQVHTTAASLDLAAGQWAILRHLEQHTQYGRTADDIAAYFAEPPVAMRHVLASLVRKGLILPDAVTDNLKARYALTAAGEEKLEYDPVGFATRAIEKMSEADRTALCRLLETLLAALTQRE